LIWCNGLQNNVTNITLELILFPHGHGAYGGKIPIHEFLNFCMRSLFSPFVSYKPYLFNMYKLWQLIQLIK